MLKQSLLGSRRNSNSLASELRDSNSPSTRWLGNLTKRDSAAGPMARACTNQCSTERSTSLPPARRPAPKRPASCKRRLGSITDHNAASSATLRAGRHTSALGVPEPQ